MSEEVGVSYCSTCATALEPGQRYCPVCGASVGAAVLSARAASVTLGASREPERQARWSILLRPVLVLPLVIVVLGAEILAAFCVLAAWFSALVLARVPNRLQDLLTNLLRVYAHVLFYGWFLFGRWPGVAFHERGGQPVSLVIDHVGLRRTSVFFRIVLGYPASLVGSALLVGATPFLAIMWIWGAIMGVEPRSLHQMMSLVARYQVRLSAYAWLLTPTQPFGGLFGDAVAPSPPPAPPTSWAPTRAAKVLLVVALVLSVPLYVLYADADRPLTEGLVDRVVVSLSHHEALSIIASFHLSANQCGATGHTVCVSTAASAALGQLGPLDAITDHDVVSDARDAAALRSYRAAFRALESTLTAIEDDTSAAAQSVAVGVALKRATSLLNRDYQRLDERLGW